MINEIIKEGKIIAIVRRNFKLFKTKFELKEKNIKF